MMLNTWYTFFHFKNIQGYSKVSLIIYRSLIYVNQITEGNLTTTIKRQIWAVKYISCDATV